MNAYLVRAVFPPYGPQALAMIVLHPGSKREVDDLVTRDGWRVERVTVADRNDVEEFGRFETLRVRVRDAAKQQQAAAEADRRAAAEQARRDEERRQLAVAREREEADRRDHAIAKAAGDLLAIDPETGLRGNAKVGSICAKALLFFGHASVNRRDIFTSASLDLAEFQGRGGFAAANQLLSKLVSDLNDFLKVDDEVARLVAALDADRVSTENQINSIGSRTHVFGGSGDGLLLSALLADGAVRKDRRAIDSLASAHTQRARQVARAVERGRLDQQVLAFRAKVAVSLLLVACGKSDTIEVDMPAAVEQYVLGC
jgi:hypothetical protein